MPSSRKLLLLGRPGIGKTSIKQVLFDGKDPMELLEKPLKATRSLETTAHPWLDLTLSVFDMPGQNLNRLFTEEKLQIKAFSKADVIIYLLDYSSWHESNATIIEDLKKIQELLKKENYSGKVIALIHKIDLIEEEKREKKLASAENKIKQHFDINVFFTSIVPGFLFYLYDAIYDIISQFSEEKSELKSIFDSKIQGLSKTAIYVTNNKNNIVTQSASADFEFDSIHDIYDLIGTIDLTIEKMRADDKIEHFMLQSVDGFKIMLKNMGHPKHDLKNVIGVSGSLTPNKLIFMIGELSREIFKYYNNP